MTVLFDGPANVSGSQCYYAYASWVGLFALVVLPLSCMELSEQVRIPSG